MLMGAQEKKNTRLTRISIRLVFFLLASFLLLLKDVMVFVENFERKAQQTLK